MKTTFTTILAATAMMALNGQAQIMDGIETNPFYRLLSNRLAENHRNRPGFAQTDAESESCIEATANLYQGDDEHIAIKSDRWEGPEFAQVDVDIPTCGSTIDKQAATQPGVDSIITAGSVWTDSAYGRSVALDGMDDTSWGWTRAQDRYSAALGHTLWGDGGFKWYSLNQGGLGDCWFLCSM